MLLQRSSPLAQASKFSLCAKSSGISKLGQAGARSSAPRRAGRTKPSKVSFSCPQAPDDTSEHPNPIAPRCPSQRRPVTPRPPHSLPSLVVADRQAAKAMMMESEDVRSPCAHAMVWRGHRLRDGAAGVVLAPFCQRAPGATAHGGSCTGTLRTLLASTQARGSAGRAQPACHCSQANGVGGLCSEPPFLLHTHTCCTQPEHPKCGLCSPAILFSSLPRHAVLAAEQPLRCSCSPSLFSAPVLLLSEPNRQPAPWPSAAAAPCPGPACRMVAPASSPRPWGQTGEALRFLPPPGRQNGMHVLGYSHTWRETGLPFSPGAPRG